jgi:hypothetical protein
VNRTDVGPDETGVVHGLRLFRQIRDLGYDGSYPVVRNYLDQHRPAKTLLPEAPPAIRDVTNWLTRRPDTLTEDEKPRLTAILDRCPELRAASDQVRAFVSMLTELTGQDLPQWTASAREVIKRQMFGRAGLPLLRNRVLLTARIQPAPEKPGADGRPTAAP